MEKIQMNQEDCLRFGVTDVQLRRFNLRRLVARLLQLNTVPPKSVRIDAGEVHCLLHRAKSFFMQQKQALLEISEPVWIAGDLHGHYHDLLRIFRAGKISNEKRYLFLGDYVDRGRHSTETCCLLLALMLLYPQNIFMLRGNHETSTINSRYGFFNELVTRYEFDAPGAGRRLFDHFNLVFAWMPLAAIVTSRILCCHGGISPLLTSLDSIRSISLPLNNLNDNKLAVDLLWADPDSNAKGFSKNLARGTSVIFNEEQVEKVAAALGIDFIIRAHQLKPFGYEFFGQRMITVFSASRYEDNNFAAIISVSEKLELSTVQFCPESYGRLPKDNIVKDEVTIEDFGVPAENGASAAAAFGANSGAATAANAVYPGAVTTGSQMNLGAVPAASGESSRAGPAASGAVSGAVSAGNVVDSRVDAKPNETTAKVVPATGEKHGGGGNVAKYSEIKADESNKKRSKSNKSKKTQRSSKSKKITRNSKSRKFTRSNKGKTSTKSSRSTKGGKNSQRTMAATNFPSTSSKSDAKLEEGLQDAKKNSSI